TPNEAAYGVYNDAIRKNEQASVISWTGSGPAPVLILTDYGNADSSNCPGINTATFQCAYETFKITVQSDSYGCPWLA
ncbi:StfH/YfcO family fimbrial adhesin, partial [Escherichia coli]